MGAGLLSAGHSLCPTHPVPPAASCHLCGPCRSHCLFVFFSVFFLIKCSGVAADATSYLLIKCMCVCCGPVGSSSPANCPHCPGSQWISGPALETPQTLAHGGWVGWRAYLTRRVWVARSPSTWGSLKDSPGHPKARWGPPSWALTRCPWGLGAQGHALALGLRDYSCVPLE